ncbi:MAG TPA: response regulator transcription factor [Candidatus Acidoferrales bacterium]|nr:response regulator transcription factor [Candidatus Acidoferrales bacterium]
MLKILIADESREFRKFIRRVSEAEQDLEVAGEATSGPELLTLARQLKPDVALVDVALSGMGGLEEARRIKLELPDTRVILLSLVDESAVRDAAMRYGADAFLSTGAPISEILTQIRGRRSKAFTGGA